MRSLTAGAAKKKSAKSSPGSVQLPIVCDADTLRSLVRKKAVRVVDVRKTDDYNQEHIPTAVSLPLARVLENDAPETIVTILAELGISDKTPVVVFDDTLGDIAARVASRSQYTR